MTNLWSVSRQMSVSTGTHNNYRWLQSTEHGIDDVLHLRANIVLERYWAVTSCDSGPLPVSDEQKRIGWKLAGGIAYSPIIHALDMLPIHALYDEWFVFENAVDLGGVHRGNVFEGPRTPGSVMGLVNFGFIPLDAVDFQDLVAEFWREIEWVQPEAYIAESDARYLTFITRNSEDFALLRLGLASHE